MDLLTPLIYQSPDNPFSHHTAIARAEASFPARYLQRQGLVIGRVLDFGCGQGADVAFFQRVGCDISGYDPYYCPTIPTGPFDTILCTYVLNVLLPVEQSHVLMAVSELLAPHGCAYFTVRRDISYNGYRRHAIHRTDVYQCRVRLPYRSLLRVRHCEIYAYTPLAMSNAESHRECRLCNPRGHFHLITESATVYAVSDPLFPASRILIVPKEHFSSLAEVPARIISAIDIVAARVRAAAEAGNGSPNWDTQHEQGRGHHAHLAMSYQ